VGSAAQAEVFEAVLAAFAPRVQVGVLEGAGGATAVAVLADETAAALVALPDGALEFGGDGSAGAGAYAARHTRGPGFLGPGGFLLLGLGEQCRQSALDDGGGIAVWDLVSEQILQLAELVVGLLIEGDGELVAARG
jgi:hypothetical protein